MVEIVKTPSVMADTELSQVLDRYEGMINEFTPRNAKAVWDCESQGTQQRVSLQITDTYSQSRDSLNSDELNDVDGMLDRISRLVGDLVYQECQQLMEPETLAQLASFAPGRLCSRFAGVNPRIPLPSTEETSCAVLFADISGFTRLTERLAAKGAVGAEELTAALNQYFGQLIDIIDEFGGDVLKFAGDALLAVFEDRQPDADLVDASVRATAASLVIQQQMRDFPEVEGTKLSLKIGLAAGPLRLLHLGGVFGRCELLMVGDPLKELSDANDAAGPGDIIAAASLWRRIESRISGRSIEGRHYQIQSMKQDARQYTSADSSGQSILAHVPFQGELIAAIRGYIPAAIYSRLAAGQTDWLGELRKVTVVFANLPGFNNHTSLQEAQQVMTALQQSIYHFEGSLNKLSVDDKGVSLLAGFGLPPVAHEDDAARAIGAALALKERMNDLGWDCSIGVATGRIFCGAYGNEERREYTMIGDTVNISARLMQSANLDILADEETFNTAGSQFEFETLDPVRMKGKRETVPCFRPVERRVPSRSTSAGKGRTIGRMSEQQVFVEQLQQLCRSQRGSTLVLEGEAGIGKSHLANLFGHRAEEYGCRVLHGHSDAIESSTPWYAWRSIIEDIIGLKELPTAVDACRDDLSRRYGLEDDLQRLLPLLSSVLPVNWPDNEWTGQMKGAIRADNTNRLLIRLLSHTAHDQPTVLVIEDIHLLDTASLQLLQTVVTQVRTLLTVMTTRPLRRPLSRNLAVLLDSSHSSLITLESMSPDESVRMAELLLDSRRLPRPIEELIRTRTQGQPLYVEELVYALRDSGTLQVVDGAIRLTGNLDQFELRDVSGSLEGVIINRVDRLPPTEQLTLKVASVIGYEFGYPLLRDVFPIDRERNQLRNHLGSLDRSRLIHSADAGHETEHVFRNRAIRDVAYNLVLVKHRTTLHREIAGWIEERHRGELDGHYPRLAEHWMQAGNPVRAIECLEAAGQNALVNNANQEAVTFYRTILELARQTEVPVDQIRLGKWHRKYGEALYRTGEVPASMRHLREALTLLGHPDSESVIPQLLNGGVEMVRQLVTRVRRRFLKRSRVTPDEGLLESIRAYERLVEIQYQRTDMPAFLLATFRSLNLAERYGFSPELARSYSNISAMTSAMMLPSAADKYTNRAKSVAGKSHDLTTTAYVQTINSVHFIGQGNWEAARETLDQALDLCTTIGDRRRWSEATALTLNLSCWNGEWDRLAQVSANLCEAVDSGLGIQVATWAYGWLLWVESARNPQSAKVLSAELELRHWLEADEELALADEVLARGGLLFTRLRRGEWQSALEIADQIETVIGNAQPAAVYLLPVYAGLVELYSAICASDPDGGQAPGMMKRLRRMHRRLAIFSLLIPISSPLKHLCAGRCDALRGRKASAQKSFRQGLQQSRKYRIPYFTAMLEFELSRLADSDAARHESIESARAGFQKLGIDPSGIGPDADNGSGSVAVGES